MLVNFALVGRTDLVTRFFGAEASTTDAVLAEYQAGAASGQFPPDAWVGLELLTLTEPEVVFADALPAKLGPGERSCLAVALHRQGTLATDDRDARKLALRDGVPVIGTLGLLVQCVEQSYLTGDEANALLARMVAAGYRSPVTSLDALLRS